MIDGSEFTGTFKDDMAFGKGVYIDSHLAKFKSSKGSHGYFQNNKLQG